MKVPALIMAGGKGIRIGLPVEKPLLPFLEKTRSGLYEHFSL